MYELVRVLVVMPWHHGIGHRQIYFGFSGWKMEDFSWCFRGLGSDSFFGAAMMMGDDDDMMGKKLLTSSAYGPA